MLEREYFLWKTWSQAGSLLLTGEHHLDRIFWSGFFFIQLSDCCQWWWLIITNCYWFPPCFLLTITDYYLYHLLLMFITDYYWLWLSMLILLLIMIWVLLLIATTYQWWSEFTSGTGRDAESFSSPPFVFSNRSLTEVFWTWSPNEVFRTWSSTEYFLTWSSPTTAFASLGQTPITWDRLEDFNEGVGDSELNWLLLLLARLGVELLWVEFFWEFFWEFWEVFWEWFSAERLEGLGGVDVQICVGDFDDWSSRLVDDSHSFDSGMVLSLSFIGNTRVVSILSIDLSL